MIVVVGRAGLDEQGALSGTAARVALEAAAGGRPVELVGTVGDDADGDMAVLALARAGIGHAAVLRDPAGVTPRAGGDPGAAPRLEAGHWTTIDGLRTNLPSTDVLADVRVVDEGEIITSAGVSAGIDMALHVVRRLHGDEVARRTARDMEYDGGDRVLGSKGDGQPHRSSTIPIR